MEKKNVKISPKKKKKKTTKPKIKKQQAKVMTS
jgi:hypothetical protein